MYITLGENMTEILTTQPLYSFLNLVSLALVVLVVGLSLAFFRLLKTSILISSLSMVVVLGASLYNLMIKEYSIETLGSNHFVKNKTLYSKTVFENSDPLVFNSTPAVGDTTKAINEVEDVVGSIECGKLSVKDCFSLLSKNLTKLKTQNNQIIDVEKLRETAND